MLIGIHGYTPHRRSDPQPAAPPCFPQMPSVLNVVAGDPDSRARIPVDLPHFAALQPHVHPQRLPRVLGIIFVLVHDHGPRPGRPADLSALVRPKTHVEHDRARRYHVQREAVAPPRRSRSKHTDIRRAAQGIDHFLGDALSERLDDFSRAHALRSDNVAQSPRGIVLQQRDMRRPARIVFDPLHRLLPSLHPTEVDHPDPPFVPASTVPHGDSAGIVSTADMLAFSRKREGIEGSAFP